VTLGNTGRTGLRMGIAFASARGRWVLGSGLPTFQASLSGELDRRSIWRRRRLHRNADRRWTISLPSLFGSRGRLGRFGASSWVTAEAPRDVQDIRPMTTIDVSSLVCFAQRTLRYLAALIFQIEDVRVRNYTACGGRLAAAGCEAWRLFCPS
jgi:hypothetical protein